MDEFQTDLVAYLTARWGADSVVYVDGQTSEVFIDDHVFTVSIKDDVADGHYPLIACMECGTKSTHRVCNKCFLNSLGT